MSICNTNKRKFSSEVHKDNAERVFFLIWFCSAQTDALIVLYSVYQKKLYPLKFKLPASYCVNLTALNASNK